ncbi:uncharacterized protein G2W53_027829 [Senna tora]|uniref:Uncharacterized protein n=1 Tax=Senna tora TaxID=362788 RepID=A0A834TRB5_9FABA|nr:uncharacterized protein G2W53_027829 [Senna tora]
MKGRELRQYDVAGCRISHHSISHQLYNDIPITSRNVPHTPSFLCIAQQTRLAFALLEASIDEANDN